MSAELIKELKARLTMLNSRVATYTDLKRVALLTTPDSPEAISRIALKLDGLVAELDGVKFDLLMLGVEV